ncbi:MAG TPA: alpha-L-rhamnosidase C-terminal domain-containing protein [Chitinophagaceae bacterium]|nr:alpha-L-rhamnosidase C-terminal domain-containing protein [Chitinophagaceae bacterium]
MKKILVLLGLVFCMEGIATAQKQATWIWYPGDFEIWLSNEMQNRRTERNTFLPPFWKLDSHYPLIDFHRDYNLKKPEKVKLYVEGKYNVKIDGKAIMGAPEEIEVPAGKHRLSLKVFNQATVPAIYVKGKTIVSDSSWLLTYEDKEWIDQSGKASDQSGTTWLNAGHWNLNDSLQPPSTFHLPTKPEYAKKTKRKNHSLFIDFGKETFGFIKLHGLEGKGKVMIYYGESKEEALSVDSCETLDRLDIISEESIDSILPDSKAFRYVNIQYSSDITIDSVSMLYEYAPVTERGSFRCSDDEINEIYDVSKYTFHLNTREFFIDGIKRDRWIWSGDAYQSYLMNYYSYFDSPTVRRTLLALRGKNPVSSHINTIMDYTFYWFMGIYDYYLYTGDKSFIRKFYPRMKSMMKFVLGRRDKNGLLEGLPGDWVFIDWAKNLSKKGALSFEQLLFTRSLETMAISAKIAGKEKDADRYKQLANQLKSKLFDIYWNKNKHAFVHSFVNGSPTNSVRRYTNMFAIFFGYLNDKQKEGVKDHVLLNDKVPEITTPYMRFYELEALCALGEQDYVLNEIKDYWGGMLKLGATTFWEEYNPKDTGVENYAMYGRPFGKSLCHAWGASPIYLLGKYYLGVRPTGPGYKSYVIQPKLGGLKWMKGTVPTPDGDIAVYCSTQKMKIKGAGGNGTLCFQSKTQPVCQEGVIKSIGHNKYEMEVEKGKEYNIEYTVLKK